LFGSLHHYGNYLGLHIKLKLWFNFLWCCYREEPSTI